MKNIHVLPTDKASRLLMSKRNHLQFLKDNASLNPNNHFEGSYQNIYITSDEYIGLSYYLDGNLVRKGVIDNKEYWKVRKDYKKIILTDNKDLIKDGVQAIDDEFLQWFVKNPSCEEVEVETTRERNGYHSKHKKSYKIIIPQEEPKQSTVGKEFYESTDEIITVYKQDIIQLIEDRILSEYKKHSASLPDEWAKIAAYKIYKSISDKMEESKQHVEFINSNIEEFEGKLKEFKQVTSIDWLEKQLDNNDFSNHQMEVNISMSLPKYIEIFKQSKEMYNQERMYSEEDLKQSYSQGWMTRERFDDLSPEIVYPDGLDYEEKQEYAFNLWFNQFKKK
jgi:hypothetical protein